MLQPLCLAGICCSSYFALVLSCLQKSVASSAYGRCCSSFLPGFSSLSPGSAHSWPKPLLCLVLELRGAPGPHHQVSLGQEGEGFWSTRCAGAAACGSGRAQRAAEPRGLQGRAGNLQPGTSPDTFEGHRWAMLCKAASPHPVHLPPGTWLPFTKVLQDVTEHPCTIPAPGAGHTWVRGATSSVLEVVALPAPCRPQDGEVLGSGHPQNGVCPRSWGSTAQQCRRGSSVGSGASLLSVQVRAREPRNFLTKQTTLVPDGICAHARYKLSPQLPCWRLGQFFPPSCHPRGLAWGWQSRSLGRGVPAGGTAPAALQGLWALIWGFKALGEATVLSWCYELINAASPRSISSAFP